jgi:hypothetical protein
MNGRQLRPRLFHRPGRLRPICKIELRHLMLTGLKSFRISRNQNSPRHMPRGITDDGTHQNCSHQKQDDHEDLTLHSFDFFADCERSMVAQRQPRSSQRLKERQPRQCEARRPVCHSFSLSTTHDPFFEHALLFQISPLLLDQIPLLVASAVRGILIHLGAI